MTLGRFALLVLLGCGARNELPVPVDPCAGVSRDLTGLVEISLTSAAPSTATEIPFALTIAGSSAYWSSTFPFPPNYIGMVRTPLRDDDPTNTSVFGDDAYSAGPLANDGAYLYFAAPAADGTRAFPSVMAKRLFREGEADELAFQIPNPPLSNGTVRDLHATTDPGVYWLFGDPSSAASTLFVQWDGARTKTIASIPAYASEFAAHGDQAFVLATTDPVHPMNQVLYGVSLPDGEVTEVRSLSQDARLLGLTDQALYYYDSGATSIVRHDRATAVETVLLAGALVTIDADTGEPVAWVDAKWVYYAEIGTIYRVSTEGGAREVVQSGDVTRGTTAIASDACAVYWVNAIDSRDIALNARGER